MACRRRRQRARRRQQAARVLSDSQTRSERIRGGAKLFSPMEQCRIAVAAAQALRARQGDTAAVEEALRGAVALVSRQEARSEEEAMELAELEEEAAKAWCLVLFQAGRSGDAEAVLRRCALPLFSPHCLRCGLTGKFVVEAARPTYRSSI